MLYVWRADRAYIVKYTGRMHKMRLYLCFYYTKELDTVQDMRCEEEKEESTGWKRRN